jgi:hypothetical protein
MDFYLDVYTKVTSLVLNVGHKPHFDIQVIWKN